MIYIIFGASGSGKTTLLNLIKSNYDNVDIHIKATTRKVRMYDDKEIISMPLGIPTEKYDYIYSQYGYEYGIERSQIEKSLSAGRHHFIICNDVDTIEKIKVDYPGKVTVIFLRFDAPKEVLEQIQKTRKISDDEIGIRLNKIQYLNQLFIDRSSLFDEVIKNNFGDSADKMLYQMDRIINQSIPHRGVNTESDVKEILNIIKKNDKDLEETKETNATIKDFLFIIMAMLEKEPVLDDIHSTFRRVCNLHNLNAERVDDSFGFQQINLKVLNHIKLAEYILADLTFERPNCYYEIGYAHALNKKVILTARKPTKVHFDIVTFPVVMYESMHELENKLKIIFDKLIVEKKK